MQLDSNALFRSCKESTGFTGSTSNLHILARSIFITHAAKKSLRRAMSGTSHLSLTRHVGTWISTQLSRTSDMRLLIPDFQDAAHQWI